LDFTTVFLVKFVDQFQNIYSFYDVASFLLKVATPYKQIFSQEVESLLVETATGQIEILPNHEDILTQLSLGLGEIKISESDIRSILIDNGLIKVYQNVVEVTAISCQIIEANKNSLVTYEEDFHKRLTKMQTIITNALKNQAYFTSSQEHIYSFEAEKLAKFELLKELTKGY